MVSCKFRCPAGMGDKQGNYVACKGDGFPDLVRLREHLTRVHCADGDRHKTDVKQLSKEQIAEWFRLWNEHRRSRADGWAVIFSDIWPDAAEVPPPFNASKEDMLSAASNLTAEDMWHIENIALRDHCVKLPQAASQCVSVVVDTLHKYLQYTGGEATATVAETQSLPNSTVTEPATQHDVYIAQAPWPNFEPPDTT